LTTIRPDRQDQSFGVGAIERPSAVRKIFLKSALNRIALIGASGKDQERFLATYVLPKRDFYEARAV
jgi:hypothetical protein